MATGGCNFDEETNQMHDETFDFLCSLCEFKNKNKEAEKYCVDCNDYYCSKCVKFHEDIPALAKHEILDKDKFRSKMKSAELPVPTERCDKHKHNHVDMYCQEHNVVSCATCIVVYHRSCEDTFYIPDYLASNNNDFKVEDTDKKLQEITKKLQQHKEKFEDRRSKLLGHKEQLLQEVHTLRRNIDTRLDTLEEVSIKEIEEASESILEKIQDNIQEVEQSEELLLAAAKNLVSCQSNISQDFVNFKKSEHIAKEVETFLNRSQPEEQGEELNFEVIDILLDMLNEMGSLLVSNKTDWADFENSKDMEENLSREFTVENNQEEIRNAVENNQEEIRNAVENNQEEIRNAVENNQGEIKIRNAVENNQGEIKIRNAVENNQGEIKIRNAVENNQGEIKNAVENNQEEIRNAVESNQEEIRNAFENNQGMINIRNAVENNQGEIKIRNAVENNQGEIRNAVENNQGEIRNAVENNQGEIRNAAENNQKQMQNLNEFNLKSRKRFDVKYPVDLSTPNIYSVCFLPDGTLVLADYSNLRLKQVERINFSLIDYCDFPCKPWQVCTISENEVAVSCLEKGIQFLSIHPKMKKTRKINLKHSCRGLAYANGKLYVSDLTSVYIYLVRGINLEQISNFPTDSAFSIFAKPEPFFAINAISVSNDGFFIYVADIKRGLVVLDINGHVGSKCDKELLLGANYVSVTENGSVLVAGIHSRNVVQLKPQVISGKLRPKDDGEKFGLQFVNEILRVKNTKVILCVYHDHLSNNIIVASINQRYLEVYELE